MRSPPPGTYANEPLERYEIPNAKSLTRLEFQLASVESGFSELNGVRVTTSSAVKEIKNSDRKVVDSNEITLKAKETIVSAKVTTYTTPQYNEIFPTSV